MMNVDINGISYHVDMKVKDFHLFCCMDLQVIQKPGSLFVQQWGKSRRMIAIDIIGHGQIGFP